MTMMQTISDRTYLLTRLLHLEQQLYQMQCERDEWRERAHAWQYKFYRAGYRVRRRAEKRVDGSR